MWVSTTPQALHRRAPSSPGTYRQCGMKRRRRPKDTWVGNEERFPSGRRLGVRALTGERVAEGALTGRYLLVRASRQMAEGRPGASHPVRAGGGRGRKGGDGPASLQLGAGGTGDRRGAVYVFLPESPRERVRDAGVGARAASLSASVAYEPMSPELHARHRSRRRHAANSYLAGSAEKSGAFLLLRHSRSSTSRSMGQQHSLTQPLPAGRAARGGASRP